MIHPDDYRLAERLVATGELQMPPAAPLNWVKPTSLSASPSAKAESDAGPNLNADTNTSDMTSASTTEEAVSDAVASAATDATPESVVAVAINEPTASEPVASESTSQDSAQLDTQSEASLSEAESAAPSASLDTTITSEVVPDAVNLDAIPSFATLKSEADSSADSSRPKQNIAPKPTPILVLAPTNPENPDGPAIPTALTIDVEKLSRSWQVGREKTRFVGRSLQQPFADSRDFRMPIPLLTSMPTMETLRPGQTVWGIVIGVADFGAFMDLGPDCNGLVHVSRLSREFVEDPQEVVQIGDLIQVWVLHVDLDKRRIALSALPPGVEQSRRPGSFDTSRDENRRDGRSDGNNRGQSQGGRYAGSNRSSDNRSGGNRSGSQPVGAQQGQSPSQQSGGQQSGGQRPSSGFGGNRGSGPGSSGGPPRSGQSAGQGQGSNRGGQGGGSREGYGGRGNSYRDRSDSRNEVKAFNKKQDKPSKPAPPISDAMKEGKEPMRSFSDLIQFMQPKRTEPLPSVAEKSTPKNSPAATSDATNESITSVAESIVQLESNLRSDAVVQDTVIHNPANADQAVVQPAAKQVIDTTVEDVKVASEPAE
jgi:predicted RNA-binding protein with RPS1 domain